MTIRRPVAPRRPRRNRYRRPAAERGRRLRRLLQGFGLTVLMVGLSVGFVLVHDIATQCRWLSARHIAVIGNRHLDEMEVIRQAGIHNGINLLSVRLGACRTRLLADPWIREASVRRQLPDRLEIRIVEHQALAVAEVAKDRYLIDADGLPFKRWSSGDPDDLPVVTGLAYADLPALEPPDTKLLAAALEALGCWRKAAPGAQAGSAPVRIVVDRESGLSIETGSSLGLVVLGNGNYPEKFANLSRFVQTLATEGAAGWRRIDLTHPQRIVARPDSGSKEV